jgi:predicted P-loop ATPase
MTDENPHRIAADAARVKVDQLPPEQSTESSSKFQSHGSQDGPQTDAVAPAFLQLILPDRGPYIAWIKTSDGRKYNRFASTIKELWEIIKEEDRLGHTAYHACASFKEAKSDPRGTPPSGRRFGRTKHNVAKAKSLWSDIDAGLGKPYPDWRSALQAVASFCKATGLPEPVCVFSGLGLHVYWPLEEFLDAPTWERYARGLKALFIKHGLHADPTRTADITSVLRTPGTHHRKSGVRLVECPKLVGPYSIEQFAILLSNASGKGAKDVAFLETPREPPPHLSSPRSKRITETLARNLSSFEPSSGARIADRCEQVGALRDTKGTLVEPLWYSSLCVLAFAQDGDPLAHEWSSGDPRYTQGETEERLKRARQLSGPTTCARFHQLNPAVCERCHHWQKIRSPIELGRIETAQSGHGLVRAANGSGDPASQPKWERTKGGGIKPGYVNACLALADLDIGFSHDIFHNKKIVEGDVAENVSGELSDAICRALRDVIIARFGFDPGKENVLEAAERACEKNRFDPVCDYLAGLRWDDQQRLDTWVINYLGAEDTPLNRAFGRKMLVAAVRRARRPGCKFDYVPVLEGETRTGKSTAVCFLAGEKNFSDQPILHLDTRAQQEKIAGVWMYELGELAGMKRTDVETLKNFLSRTEDNARPAYGRFRTDQPRRGIFVGTTNDDQYLRDPTGNARFWPIRTGDIDLEALRRDRDQLWAEAALAEEGGESLVIPENLYQAATAAQDERLMQDPWEILLEDLTGQVWTVEGEETERIATLDVMRRAGIDGEVKGEPGLRRLKAVMHRLGWQGPKKLKFTVLDGGTTVKKVTKAQQGYWRPVKKQLGAAEG